MWALLERLGIGRSGSFPYPIRPLTDSNSLKRAAAARVRAKRLLVVDWIAPPPSPGLEAASVPAADLAHLPARAALRLLR